MVKEEDQRRFVLTDKQRRGGTAPDRTLDFCEASIHAPFDILKNTALENTQERNDKGSNVGENSAIPALHKDTSSLHPLMLSDAADYDCADNDRRLLGRYLWNGLLDGSRGAGEGNSPTLATTAMMTLAACASDALGRWRRTVKLLSQYTRTKWRSQSSPHAISWQRTFYLRCSHTTTLHLGGFVNDRTPEHRRGTHPDRPKIFADKPGTMPSGKHNACEQGQITTVMKIQARSLACSNSDFGEVWGGGLHGYRPKSGRPLSEMKASGTPKPVKGSIEIISAGISSSAVWNVPSFRHALPHLLRKDSGKEW
ncbi:hypothetical protein B0H16DRAFT_1761519 [Mycena metata]|uniref:Uncharacterized protein n=1 Tax=Mycena metata TaxID=1033252 RepID=A0AAD7IA11_9AGAR|nr:hypothetical protein B0H16DRAFT_1761519 [Mycena metata]